MSDLSVVRTNVRSLWGVLPRPGTRPKRVSRSELIRVERSKKRADALLLAWSAWMADKRSRPLRPQSRYNYRQKLKTCFAVAEAANRSVIAGNVNDVRYILGRQSPHPSTQAGYLNALRSFYDFLKEQGIRKDNPAREIGRPPQFRGQPRPMSIEDGGKYLDAAYSLGVRHYAIACLGLYTGLRREEIRLRQWADFFEADGRMWCDVDGKGGRKRRAFVHPQVRVALRRLRDEHNDATWLFPSTVRARAGQPVSVHWLQLKHVEICQSAGVTCTLHQLRHTFATRVRAVGGDLALVQASLGHSSPQTTLIYMDLLPGEVAETVERVDYPRSNVGIQG